MEIEFYDVDYIYNEKLKLSKKALDNINLIIDENKIYGLIGENGSGKTTFLQLINNLLIPSAGELKVEGHVLKKGKKQSNINSLRKRVGLVFQFPEEQFFESTVEKEIAFALKNFNIKDSRTKIINVLKMVDLDESYLDLNPFQLSSGDKRKIAIASTLVYNPKILMLDEPTVGLDYINKRNLLSLLRRLNTRYNKTILIVSHDTDMLYRLVDNVIILKDGQILIEGPKDEVFRNNKLLKDKNIPIPNIVKFSKLVFEKKKIKLGEYDDIKDLIKAVYRSV